MSKAPTESEQAVASPWDTTKPPPSAVVFDALLKPHRSLPKKAFRLLMILFIAQSIVRSAIFWAMGAWPCVAFLAIDLLIVYVAFRANYRHGRLFERIQLTANELGIDRVWPDGRHQTWRFEPYWTRVELENQGEQNCRVIVVDRGKRVTLGAFLAPWERPAIAEALKEALARRPRPSFR